MTTNTKKYTAMAGLLLCAASMAIAQTSNSVVVFSVDMSVQVGDSTFVPGTDQVEAHGTFNGWGALVLTNDLNAANTNLYSGTAVDTADANGGTLQYKFVINGANWEDTATSENRAARLPANSGDTLMLPTAYYNDAGPAETNLVTFQVDMAQQINIGAFDAATDEVDARGDFNGWGTSALTNDQSILRTNEYGLVTSNVYVGTFQVAASPGAAQAYKFYYNNGADQWETPNATNQEGGGNRYFANVPQTLPVVYFNDAPYAPVATNNVTFQVDMSAQLLGGAFDPSQDTVDVRGTFNGWTGSANICTNDPNASNTNIYSTVIQVVDGVGATEQYKFTYSGANVPGPDAINTAWEQPGPATPQIGGNRFFYQPNSTSTILPVVFFSDQPVSDLLQRDTLVTFSVDMNGAVGTDEHPFDSAYDTVYVNGQFVNWYPWWGDVNPVPAPSQYQLYENPPGSGIFSRAVLLPQGTPVSFEYKYGIGEDGAPGPTDNEAASEENHFRVVRSTASGAYQMPQDVFGNQYHEPTSPDLAVRSASGGDVQVTWLGRPGVYLQSSTNLSSPWQDHLETDGTDWAAGYSSTNGLVSATNWPAKDATFFRLIKQ